MALQINSLNPIEYLSQALTPEPILSKKELDIPPELLDNMKTYMGPGYTNTPGSINIFFLPFDLIHTYASLCYSKSIGDAEGELDATIRLAGMPANLAHSLVSITSIVVQAGMLFRIIGDGFSSHFLKAANPALSAAGIGLCLIEGIFEALNLKRQNAFLDHLNHHMRDSVEKILKIEDPKEQCKKLLQLYEKILSKHEDFFDNQPQLKEYLGKVKKYLENPIPRSDLEKECLQGLSAFAQSVRKNSLLSELYFLKNEYMTVSPATIEKIKVFVEKKFGDLPPEEKKEKIIETYHKVVESKLAKLARRVQPWCAKEIAQNLPPILEKIKSADPKVQEEGLKEAEELMQTVKTQARKKLLVHIVAVVAIALSIAGFIALCVGCPFAIPFALLLVGGTLASLNYFLAAGTLDNKGWKFSVENCIPNWVKWIARKLFSPSEAPPIPPQKVEDLTALAVLSNFRTASKIERFHPFIPPTCAADHRPNRKMGLIPINVHAREAFSRGPSNYLAAS